MGGFKMWLVTVVVMVAFRAALQWPEVALLWAGAFLAGGMIGAAAGLIACWAMREDKVEAE